jgi:CheY-like chemotaxis protein
MERLQKNTRLSCIPVVVLTASDVRGNKEKAEAAGCCAFLQKPAENAELMAIINKALVDTGALPQQS